MPEPCGDFHFEYQSGGRTVPVDVQVCPTPKTEAELDRAWVQVIRPAIEASYAQKPPD